MRSPCQPDSRAHQKRLRPWALVGGLLLAMAASGDAAAQLRKVCKPVGVDQMVCTEDKSAKASPGGTSVVKPTTAAQETAAGAAGLEERGRQGGPGGALRRRQAHRPAERRPRGGQVGVDLCVKR
jgi:hypothetical protein